MYSSFPDGLKKAEQCVEYRNSDLHVFATIYHLLFPHISLSIVTLERTQT